MDKIQNYKDIKLTFDVESNLDIIRKIFLKDSVIRYKKIGTSLGFCCAVVFFDGMDADESQVRDIRGLIAIDVILQDPPLC